MFLLEAKILSLVLMALLALGARPTSPETVKANEDVSVSKGRD